MVPVDGDGVLGGLGQGVEAARGVEQCVEAVGRDAVAGEIGKADPGVGRGHFGGEAPEALGIVGAGHAEERNGGHLSAVSHNSGSLPPGKPPGKPRVPTQNGSRTGAPFLEFRSGCGDRATPVRPRRAPR